jgi:hypothetical protein
MKYVFPKAWKLINDFKLKCLLKGWKTSESYDWILAEKKYHTFIWTRIAYPSTFERIISNRKCIVKEGLCYRTVEASYFAWIFENSPPTSLVEKVLSNEEILRKTAIYDLSEIYKGKMACLKINKTDSPVFREFERFLKELGVKVISVSNSETSENRKKVLVSGKA